MDACVAALAVLIAASRLCAAAGEVGGEPQKPSNPRWEYGAFADLGYLRDFNDPSNGLFRSRGTAWHVNELDLNMAGGSLKRKASEDSRWGAELVVHGGKDSEVFGFSASAPNLSGYRWLRHLGLANVSYLAPVGKGLSLQGGIFTSFIGYDSLYSKDNFTYTRPWAADFTPYLMMGVNADYPLSEKLAAALFVVNGYWHLANANSVPSAGGQIAYRASARVTAKQTILWGPHQADTSLQYWRFLTDGIVERKGDRVTGALELQLSSERVAGPDGSRALWIAGQLPVHWTVHGPWSVSLRPEAAWDRDGRWTLSRQFVKAITTTLEYRIHYRSANAILRVEHRFDDSRGKQGGFFYDGAVGPGVDGLKPTQHLLIFGLILTFDSAI